MLVPCLRSVQYNSFRFYKQELSASEKCNPYLSEPSIADLAGMMENVENARPWELDNLDKCFCEPGRPKSQIDARDRVVVMNFYHATYPISFSRNLKGSCY